MTIKVLQLAKYYPPNWGGIETVTYNLNETLKSEEFELTTFAYGCEPADDMDISIVRFDYMHFSRTPMSLSMLSSIRKIANQYDYIILHVPNPWSVLSLLLSAYKGKVILYWHAESKGPKLLEVVVNFFQDKIIRRADFIFGATSEHYKNMRLYNEVSSKCHTYSYPVGGDLQEVANSIQEKRFDFKNGIKLINVGRLVEYKGQRYLIEATHKLVEKGHNVDLTIVGDGPLYEQLSEMIQDLELTEHVRILRNLDRSELAKCFFNSHIFCFPSVTEQEMYGMAQIEAYAYGLPVIASTIDFSGVAEVARASKGALLVKPRDVEGLVQSIETLISNNELVNELSQNGRNYIKSFSFENKRKELCSLLNKNSTV